MERERIIIRTSMVGIATNLLLASLKAVVGIASNSIAVILDAINNLSDVLSSVITIAGAKLAGKTPDKDHPLGHGRAEYLTALVVAAIVIYAGVKAAEESVKKIIHPQPAHYTTLALAIIAVAVIAKLLLGTYVRGKGREVNSGALIASGTDALSDAALSLGVLATALILTFTGLSLEAYMGIVISAFIIKAGIEMLRDTLDDILGKRTDEEVARRIKELLVDEPEVLGAYDLFVHNYGPDREYASVHLELPDSMTVEEVDRLTRKVTDKIYCDTGVIMTGVGVYSHNSDEKAIKMRHEITDIVMAHEWALQLHGFYLDEEEKSIRFDVVMSFDITHEEGISVITEELKKKYPDYDITVVPDIDISD